MLEGKTKSGYTLDVQSGAVADCVTITSQSKKVGTETKTANGTLIVNSGVKTSGTKIVNGTETIKSGGTSENAEISSGGTQMQKQRKVGVSDEASRLGGGGGIGK